MVSISGWVLVSSTLPTDYWKVSTIDGTVITTATYWANLWKACVTDSTGVSNCKDFPSMLALDGLHPLAPTPSPALAPPLPTGWAPANSLIPGGTPRPDSSEALPRFPPQCLKERGGVPGAAAHLRRTCLRRGHLSEPGPWGGGGSTQTGLVGRVTLRRQGWREAALSS